MQVFIGGAYNGKRAYVKNLLKERAKTDVEWICMGDRHSNNSEVLIVLTGLENWLRSCTLSEEQAVEEVMALLENRHAIVILTDIGRGIVPIDVEERKLRDACGRLYQRIMSEADEVTRIWYGIPQMIKKRGEST